MHILPVCPVTDMGSYKPGELNAFENNYINDRVEYRKIPRGSDAEANIRKALESAPHAEKA